MKLKFKRYLKEALLPEKVIRHISLDLYNRSGLKKELEYIISLVDKTYKHMHMYGSPPEKNYQLAVGLEDKMLRHARNPTTLQIWQYVKDKEWQNIFRQSGMIFQWAFMPGEGHTAAYSPTGAEQTGRGGGKNPFIVWRFPMWVVMAALKGQFANLGEYKHLTVDLQRAPESIEHEVSHAMRDLQHATLSRELRGRFTKPEVQEKYAKSDLEFHFEVDAVAHAFRALKARLGQKKWDTLTLKDLFKKYTPRPKLNSKEKRALLKRLARENLLGKRMKYSGETFEIGELKF
jgi:hypothetical protein